MEKIEPSTGVIVKSLKGHDTGKNYIIIGRVSPEFVLIADGKGRKADSPKLKRLKHLKVLGAYEGEQTDLTDSKIIRILKGYKEV